MRQAVLVVALLLAGCLDDAGLDADVTLPGVRTTSTVTDTFSCGPLLVPAGCTIVRIEHVESGCRPEAPGYAVCDATVWWNATSGTVAPGTQLTTSVNGTTGPSCEPAPTRPCTVRGDVTFTHHFAAMGQAAWWNVTFAARLEGAPPGAAGDFTLAARFVVRTEPRSAADV